MKRLLGTREDGGKESSLCDKLTIAVRALSLLGTLAACMVIAIALREHTSPETCLLSYSVSGEEIPRLSFNRPWECHMDMCAAIAVACVSGFFSLIGLRNLYKRNLKPHASLGARLNLILIVLSTVLLVVCSIITTTRLELVCDAVGIARGPGGVSCAQTFADVGSEWCLSCPSASYHDWYNTMLRVRNAFWAAAILMCVVSVLVVVRYVRARKEEEEQAQEREMRREWEEMKAKEHDAKHTGEGKGLVYRMLL